MEEWRLRAGEPPALAHMHPYHQHLTHFQIVRVLVDPRLGGLSLSVSLSVCLSVCLSVSVSVSVSLSHVRTHAHERTHTPTRD